MKEKKIHWALDCTVKAPSWTSSAVYLMEGSVHTCPG
jgi:hypothetical protein